MLLPEHLIAQGVRGFGFAHQDKSAPFQVQWRLDVYGSGTLKDIGLRTSTGKCQHVYCVVPLQLFLLGFLDFSFDITTTTD